MLSFPFAVTPPTVVASVEDTGLVNVPDSMLLLSKMGIRRLVPSASLIRMSQTGLLRAAKKGEIFHL